MRETPEHSKIFSPSLFQVKYLDRDNLAVWEKSVYLTFRHTGRIYE